MAGPQIDVSGERQAAVGVEHAGAAERTTAPGELATERERARAVKRATDKAELVGRPGIAQGHRATGDRHIAGRDRQTWVRRPIRRIETSRPSLAK